MSSDFPNRQVIAETTARMLLEIDAVHFNADKPFTFPSGIVSPVYIDCRKIISYPRIREMITSLSVSVILSEVGFEEFDAIAGGETAGIPFAAWIAAEMGLPMQYVRKKPKGFGPLSSSTMTFSSKPAKSLRPKASRYIHLLHVGMCLPFAKQEATSIRTLSRKLKPS